MLIQEVLYVCHDSANVQVKNSLFVLFKKHMICNFCTKNILESEIMFINLFLKPVSLGGGMFML